MPERIADPADPRLDTFRDLKDAELAAREGRFVAEGRLVVAALLQSPLYPTESVLMHDAAWDAERERLEPLARRTDTPVYLAERTILEHVAGFDVHRGCLAIGIRSDRFALAQLLGLDPAAGARLVVPVLEHLSNHDNVGSIYRHAAAFGSPAVVRTPSTADPLYRKAVRVSMGHALGVPSVRLDDWPGDLTRLRAAGYRLIALDRSAQYAIDHLAIRAHSEGWSRIAILIGAEGPGLSKAALDAADLHARIPIASDVDSLNAHVAAAIALHRLSPIDLPPD